MERKGDNTPVPQKGGARPERGCPHCGKPDCPQFLNPPKSRGPKFQTHQERIGFGLLNELNSITRAINCLSGIWKREIPTESIGEGHLAGIIYRGRPFITEYLETSRQLGDELDRAESVASLSIPPSLLQHDHFRGKRIPRKRLSWQTATPQDISELPLPLDNEGISKIDSLMRSGQIGPFQYGDSIAALLVTIMPIQQLARPELELSIPRGLASLNERMLAYYDYYMGFVAVPNSDPDSDYKGFVRMLWAGPGLTFGLANYIPARLGITPSSTRKLYLEQPVIASAGILEISYQKLFAEIDRTYRTDALPANLEMYQHFDRDVDRRAAEALALKLRGEDRSWDQEEVDPKVTLERLARYRQDLRSEILKSKDKSLRVNIDPEGIIRDVVITCQNKQTLMLIVTMGDGSFTTLEANNSGRLFGIPTNLQREYPHVEEGLMRAIINPVLDFARQRFPRIEPPNIQATPISAQKLPDAETYKTGLSATTEQVVIKPPKRKTLRSAIQTAITREPEMPQPAVDRKRVNRVLASRTQIVTSLPKNIPLEVIDRIMKAIKDFEFGEKKVEALTDIPEAVRLRVGNYRVVLFNIGANRYSLERAADRKEVYRQN